MKARFKEDGDGIARCRKKIMVRLSREENRFCVEQTGQGYLEADSGGGGVVDKYLHDLLLDTLRQQMAARR